MTAFTIIAMLVALIAVFTLGLHYLMQWMLHLDAMYYQRELADDGSTRYADDEAITQDTTEPDFV